MWWAGATSLARSTDSTEADGPPAQAPSSPDALLPTVKQS